MRGIYTALITPFKTSGAIDFKSLRYLIDHQLKGGVHGLIPCGTTGESPTLNQSEKIEVVSATLKHTKGTGIKIFAGSGSNSTVDTVKLSKIFSDLGVDGLLVVAPYYNKPTQAGLIEHFSLTAKAVRCQVMLYNVPSRTGVSMSADTISTLAGLKNITSLKEASGNLPFASEVLDVLNKQKRTMNLFSGDDVTFLPFLALGGCGVVSVASNLIPQVMVSLFDLYQSNNLSTATELHKKYYPLFRDLFIESNPTPIKHLLSQQGIISNVLRKPLLPLSKLASSTLSQTWRSLK